jgi:hypothetical protein
MPSSTLHRGSFSWGYRLAALWGGLAAGPVAWAALLQTNYVLSYVACEQRHAWMLHVVTAAALLLVALGARMAWVAAPGLGIDDEPASPGLSRARFMAVCGLTLCAFFALVILATEIPVLVLRPCTL